MYIYVNVCMYVFLDEYMYMYICIYIYINTYIDIHRYIHTHTHIHTLTHTYTYIHIHTQGAPTVTAEKFVNLFYTEFSYSHVGLDIMALFIFMFFLRVGTYVCMLLLRHEKR
jgi:hypothetical protein